ncbi:MAG: class I SAM-dependent rRNA methyltransferase [Calditrichaeota bacterium]|nr:class I SAM-dependent rRNA methyltransferase [Calditrichota bacterium]
MPTLILQRGKEQRILSGHPWIYAGEVKKTRGELTDGGVARVQDHAGRHLGMALVNTRSKILARLYTRGREAFDRGLLAQRLEEASRFRREFLGLDPTSGVRWVFSEGDRLPGLIVDQYADVVVVQLLTLPMDLRRDLVVELLSELFSPRAIVERSDVGSRTHEGLEPVKQVLSGEVSGPVTIEESGTRYLVDVLAGQKTGFFLDQRDNRNLVRHHAGGRRVLDAFCYTGGFAVAAAKAGAQEVLGLDSSEEALAAAKENAALNGVAERCEFEQVNVFDRLRSLGREGKRFDLVVLDPPAFAKNKASVAGAFRGYKEINLRALKLLDRGGLLLTCSCSQHMTETLFERMLLEAARDARVEARILRRTTQAADHPVVLGMPESQYLKCFWLRVV